MDNNKHLITSISLVLLGVLIGWGGMYLAQQEGWVSSGGPGLSPQKAGETVINYLNEKILQGQGLTASLVSAPVKQGGVYKLKIKIGDEEIVSYLTGDGQLLFPQAIDLVGLSAGEETSGTKGGESATTTIGNFSVSGNEPCQENGKPIVYFFGSATCPYCQWEHPVVEGVAAQFSGLIAFHNNMDSDADRETFSEYSPEGYIPVVIIGCKYFRVGAGTNLGEEEEARALSALLCDLTGGKPAEVCLGVQDLIEQLK